VEQFRSALHARTGGRNCSLVSSGRAALTLILLALRRLSARSRVIVPAYSCPTVVQAVLEAGLVPVLCDVAPQTLDLDRGAIGRLVGPDILAIVSVHLYGWAQDVRDLLSLGEQYGIFIVEDAAQAFGASFEGRMVGTRSDAGLYSLGRGKCVPAGHGGVIVSSERCAGAIDEVTRSIASKPGEGGPSHVQVSPAPRWDLSSLALLAGYGLATRPAGWWLVVRTPLNPADEGMDAGALPPISLRGMSATTAGIGASLLGRIDREQAIRRRHAARLIDGLRDLGSVAIPEIAPGAEPAFLRLPVVMNDGANANRLFAELGRRGIGVSRSYRRSLADLFSGRLGTNPVDFPGASRLAECLLTLPTHSYLQERDIDTIFNVFQANSRLNEAN